MNTIYALAKARQRAQPTYGNAVQKHPQGQHFVCWAKARLFAQTGIWPYTIGKQPARNILGTSAKAKLVARPSLWPCTIGNQVAKKYSRCLGQGQATCLARPIALHYREATCKDTFYAPQSRPGLSPGPAYGLALWDNKLQWNILGALAKGRLTAQPGLRPCTMGTQLARKHSMCLCYGRWVASTYLAGYLVVAPWRPN